MSKTIEVYNGCNGNNFPVDIASELSTHLAKRNAGRASKFTLDNAILILDALQDGKTIQQACEIAGISRPTYLTWCRLSPEFLNAVAEAQEDRADSMVDDGFATLADVDTEGREAMARLRKAEQIARYRLDIAKCLNFRKYGDKKAQLNVNANMEIKTGDASKWFNGG